MNSYISAEYPLMIEIFKYCLISDVAKWRCTSKDTNTTDLYVRPYDWRSFVILCGGAKACEYCTRLRGVSGLFFCSDCGKTVCNDHVFCCNLCSHECCLGCFDNGCLHCYM